MRKPVFSSPIFDFLLVIKNFDHKLLNLKNKLWEMSNLRAICHIDIYGNIIKDIYYLLPTC